MVMGERSVLYGEAAALLYGPRQRQEGSYMTRIGSAWPLARRLPEDTVPESEDAIHVPVECANST